MNDFTAAGFMDGRNSRTDAERESYCKGFCKYRKKHKHRVTDFIGSIKQPCDPVAEYMRQKGQDK